jgi:hypothetical protein
MFTENSAGHTEQFKPAGTPEVVGGILLGQGGKAKEWIAVPLVVAGALKVTAVQAVDAIVVPPATFAPVIVAPTNAALQPVTVAAVLPSVVVMFKFTVLFGGTVAGFHQDATYPVVETNVAVAGTLIWNWVPLSIAAIVAPEGMPGPVIVCPTTKAAVEATVTTSLPEVVEAVKLVLATTD